MKGPRVVDHLGDWRDLWMLARSVSKTHGPGGAWRDSLRREAFELLRTALVYHRNALENYPLDTLHGKLRPPSMSVRALVTFNTLLDMDDPLFHRLAAPEKMVAGPHLASAVVRVSGAVLKVAEIHKKEGRPQTDFQKERLIHEEGDEFDWSRGEVYRLGLLKRVKPLGPCEAGELGRTLVERLTSAVRFIQEWAAEGHFRPCAHLNYGVCSAVPPRYGPR
jgi:hypothetical protein